jgi:hypothetical protein
VSQSIFPALLRDLELYLDRLATAWLRQPEDARLTEGSRSTKTGCILGLPTGGKQANGTLRNFITGGDRVCNCALPGFDARYLTRAPGFDPG